jgi:hypothetical protein
MKSVTRAALGGGKEENILIGWHSSFCHPREGRDSEATQVAEIKNEDKFPLSRK